MEGRARLVRRPEGLDYELGRFEPAEVGYVRASGLRECVEPVTRACVPVPVQKQECAVREFCFPAHWNCKQAARRGLDPNPNVVKREGGARLMQELRVHRTAGIQGEGVRVVAIGKQAGIHFFLGLRTVFTLEFT